MNTQIIAAYCSVKERARGFEVCETVKDVLSGHEITNDRPELRASILCFFLLLARRSRDEIAESFENLCSEYREQLGDGMTRIGRSALTPDEMRGYERFMDKGANTASDQSLAKSIEQSRESTWTDLRNATLPYTERSVAMGVLYPYNYEVEYFLTSAPDERRLNSIASLCADLIQQDGSGPVANLHAGMDHFLSDMIVQDPWRTFMAFGTSAEQLALVQAQACVLGIPIQEKESRGLEEYMEDLMKPDLAGSFGTVYVPVAGSGSDANDEIGRNSAIYATLHTFFSVRRTFRMTSWAWAMPMLHMLSESGIGISAVPLQDLWRRDEEQYRKSLLSKGVIRAVIRLPESIGRYTVDRAAALVVYQRGSSEVRFVDACTFLTLEPEADLSSIASLPGMRELREAVFGEGHGPGIVLRTNEELIADGANLNPNDHFFEIPDYEPSVPLGSVAEIQRGVRIGNEELKTMLSEEPTDCRFVTLSDVADGCLTDRDVRWLRLSPADGLDKYIARPPDVLAAKIGEPKIVALGSDYPVRQDSFDSDVVRLMLRDPTASNPIWIARMRESETTLVAETFYILRVNPEKVNPWYLAAFLQSDTGRRLMRSGTKRKARGETISLTQLRNLPVYLPDHETQKQIADEYLEAQCAIAEHKQEIAKHEREIATEVEDRRKIITKHV